MSTFPFAIAREPEKLAERILPGLWVKFEKIRELLELCQLL